MTLTALDRLKSELGESVVRTGDAILAEKHARDFGMSGAPPDVVLLPRTPEEVSSILRICSAYGQAITPQGGLTGVVGGAVPTPGAFALSLEKLSGIEEIDPDSSTMTVLAGTSLQAVQEAAEQAGMMFALDYGSRGSCQIGGAAATNAGGNRVLRFGVARDLILGLEVVLPDGRIISSLNKMLKNNAGYDTKQIFIGSEGTLGIITRLVLRLFPRLSTASTALCAAKSYDDVLSFLRMSKSRLAGDLSAFEVMWPDFYDWSTKAARRGPPLPSTYNFYVLIDLLGNNEGNDRERFEALIAEAIEGGLVQDAVIAQTVRDAEEFWTIREASGSLPEHFGPNLNFDVSVPTREIGYFVEECRRRLQAKWPDARTLFFGHVADSNIHVAARLSGALLPKQEIQDILYGLVRELSGSVSAEHGIGMAKREYLTFSRSEAEIELMQILKSALDPQGLLNPGKVL